MIAALRAEPEARRRALDDALQAALVAHLSEVGLPETVAVFSPLPGEPAMAALVCAVRELGSRCVLPRVFEERMTLHVWGSEDGLHPGGFGIPEPAAGAPAVPAVDVGLWLVPGLLFDLAGHRLGRGRGYYDRTLAGLGARRIGVCYGAQVVDAVPAGPMDERVHALATERGVVGCPRALA